uniref:Uncharacterized protein n=1 Tax=Arundo donax TaxID=35708 RepID=A0A0A8ZDP2_ARUDO
MICGMLLPCACSFMLAITAVVGLIKEISH